MGYRFTGWAEFVVEIQIAAASEESYDRFVDGLEPPGKPPVRFLTRVPGSGLVSGLYEGEPGIQVTRVRYAGPSSQVAAAMDRLNYLCGECFPPPHPLPGARGGESIEPRQITEAHEIDDDNSRRRLDQPP